LVQLESVNRLSQPWRDAFRSLRRRPVLAATAAVVLSLGIAAVTTIFGVTSGVLFRPLPYADPDRLVFVLGGEPPGSDLLPLSRAEFALARNEARSVRGLAALTEDVALVGTGRAARSSRGLRVSSRLADTLGVGVRLGRLPEPGDASTGADPVVLGSSFWARELEADPAVVGRAIVLDGQPVRVAGVLSDAASLKPVLGFEPAWWRFLDERQPGPGGRRLMAIGRLAEGATLESAGAELRLLASRLAKESGATPGWTMRVWPVRDRIDPVAYVLVGLLLAAILGIVCLNAGALLLTRALAREREVAVRLALGAGRRDVFGQLVAEGVLVGLLGGALGLALTSAAAGLVRDLASGTNAEAAVFDVDAWVWTAAAVASLAGGVLAGLVPATYWVRQEPESILKEGAHGATATSRSRRLRNLLIASEVALSMALLSQAGLALQSLRGLLAADRGFDAGRALTARLSFGRGDPASAAAEVLQRVRAVPGVRDAAFGTALPTGAPMQPYRAVDAGPAAEGGQARVAGVSPGYFATLGIPLRAGRDFTAADASGGALVAIVNEELASRLGNPVAVLGGALEVGGVRRTVVGVVGAVRNPPLALRPRPEIYVPWAPGGEAHLIADTGLDRPLSLAPELAAALRAADLGEPPATVRSLDGVLGANMGVIRLGTLLLALVALGAAAITAAGTYGVASSLVLLRTREMGIRLALGAEPAGIRRLALRQGLRPVVAGLAAGVVAAAALGRLLSSRVYGLRPLEPAVLAIAVLAFVAVVVPACYLPARRATRVDPAVTLRCE
jgi:putative ABC transport system permease protein